MPLTRCIQMHPEGWDGLGWVSAPPEAVPHGQRDLTKLARVSHPGCLVSQPPRMLTTPEPRQDATEREIPPCLCVLRCLHSTSKHRHPAKELLSQLVQCTIHHNSKDWAMYNMHTYTHNDCKTQRAHTDTHPAHHLQSVHCSACTFILTAV